MVDFTAHFTVHAIKIGIQNWVHLPIACQSERSLRYFYLDRISD